MKEKTAISTHTFGMSRRLITWMLFILMSLTLPTLYFLVVAVAFVPLIAIGLSIFLTSDLWLIGGIHILIIGPIYFLIAHLISKVVHYVQSETIRIGLLACIAATLTIPAFFPIYVTAGHGSTQWFSWIGSIGAIK